MTVRNARLPAALALETLWSFAAAAVFVRLISGGDGPSLSLAAVAAVVLASFAVARSLPAAGVAETQARVAAIAVSAAALFLILHTEYAAAPPWSLGWAGRLVTDTQATLADRRYVVAGVVAASLLWLRGIARWSTPFEFADALSAATFGFAAIALAAVIDPPARGPHAFGATALVFFVLAWCLLALYQTADADERLPKFGARWAGAFAVVIAASAVFTFVVAAFDPGTLGFLGPPTTALLRAIGIAAAYTFGPVLALIGFLFGLIPFHSPKQQQQQAPAPAPPLKEANNHTPYWFQIVAYVLAGGGITVLALSFAAAIWIAMRRYAARKPRPAEQRRAVERDNMLAEDLAALFAGIAGRFRRRRGAESQVEIRRLYHQMLAHAEADGLQRPPAATPSQFAPQLDARYGSAAPSAISRAFVSSRYGLAEFDAGAVGELRAQWESLPRDAPG